MLGGGRMVKTDERGGREGCELFWSLRSFRECSPGICISLPKCWLIFRTLCLPRRTTDLIAFLGGHYVAVGSHPSLRAVPGLLCPGCRKVREWHCSSSLFLGVTISKTPFCLCHWGLRFLPSRRRVTQHYQSFTCCCMLHCCSHACLSASVVTVTFSWTRDFPELEPFGISVGFPGYIFNKHNNLTASPLPTPVCSMG